MADVVDLFAGPGGWDVAARALGMDPLGVEFDSSACATRQEAGLRTLQADVAALEPWPCDELIASPPCPSFSRAGRQLGRFDLTTITDCMDLMAAGGDWSGATWHDPRSRLTLEPLRWALSVRPRAIALEQVPAVLPLWEHMAGILRARGYSVWTGKLRAETFGVPQTRERAFLLASLDRAVGAPASTHSRYHERDPGRLDLGMLPWVSMAEALGWAESDRVGFPRRNDLADGGKYRERDLREASAPAFGLTEKVRSWTRTTASGEVERVTHEEAAKLQTFPGGHPWQGTKTKRFEQIGNAVPPLMALRVLEAVR